MSKTIPYFPDYEITEKGEVISYKKKEPKIITPFLASGYLQIGLCKNGEVIKKLIHRLVAETFIPNPKNLPEVNHKDGDKKNNILSNLEWVSKLENEEHAYDTGLKKSGRSSIRGVTWCNTRKKWVVRFTIGNSRRFFGYFENQHDAEKKAKEIQNENS